MDRYWLLTWATYGTWLPGDARGFVSSVRDGPGARVRHNQPATPYDADMQGLQRSARRLLKGSPITLQLEQATVLLRQFQETAAYRRWLLAAVAIMATHVHLVVGVPGDPDPADLLGDFKSYGSRALNRRWGKPLSQTWWVESGSRRRLPDLAAVLAAIEYVRNQLNPLIVWVPQPGERGALALKFTHNFSRPRHRRACVVRPSSRARGPASRAGGRSCGSGGRPGGPGRRRSHGRSGLHEPCGSARR